MDEDSSSDITGSYERKEVSSHRHDGAPINKDNIYDQAVASLCKTVEVRLQKIQAKVFKRDKNLESQLNQQEKDKLRPVFKTCLDESKRNAQHEFHKQWKKTCRKISNKLARSSTTDSHEASPEQDTTDLPEPIHKYIQKLYDFVENEMLQYVHGIISPDVVAREVCESNRIEYDIPKTIINDKIIEIIDLLLDDSNASESKEATNVFFIDNSNLDKCTAEERNVLTFTGNNKVNGKRVRFSEKDSAIGVDNSYDLEIAILFKKIKYCVQFYCTEICPRHDEMDEREKDKLRPLFKQALDQSKLFAQCKVQRHWQKIHEQICNKLANLPSASDRHQASLARTIDWDKTDIPPPLKEIIEHLVIIVEYMMLQSFDGIPLIFEVSQTFATKAMNQMFSALIDFAFNVSPVDENKEATLNKTEIVSGIEDSTLDKGSASKAKMVRLIGTKSVTEDIPFLCENSGVDSNNAELSESILVYERVSSHEEDDCHINMKKGKKKIDQVITKICEQLEDQLQKTVYRLGYSEIEMDEQEKDKLFPIVRTIVDKSKLYTQCIIQKQWQDKLKETSKEQDDPTSLDSNAASPVENPNQDKIDIPPPIQDIIDQFYNFVEFQVLEQLHNYWSMPCIREHVINVDFIKGMLSVLIRSLELPNSVSESGEFTYANVVATSCTYFGFPCVGIDFHNNTSEIYIDKFDEHQGDTFDKSKGDTFDESEGDTFAENEEDTFAETEEEEDTFAETEEEEDTFAETEEEEDTFAETEEEEDTIAKTEEEEDTFAKTEEEKDTFVQTEEEEDTFDQTKGDTHIEVMKHILFDNGREFNLVENELKMSANEGENESNMADLSGKVLVYERSSDKDNPHDLDFASLKRCLEEKIEDSVQIIMQKLDTTFEIDHKEREILQAYVYHIHLVESVQNPAVREGVISFKTHWDDLLRKIAEKISKNIARDPHEKKILRAHLIMKFLDLSNIQHIDDDGPVEREHLYQPTFDLVKEYAGECLQELQENISKKEKEFPPVIEIDKQEREKLLRLIKPGLNQIKLDQQREFRRGCQEAEEELLTELADSLSTDSIENSPVAAPHLHKIYPPNPKQECNEQVFNIYESELLQFVHAFKDGSTNVVKQKGVERFEAMLQCLEGHVTPKNKIMQFLLDKQKSDQLILYNIQRAKDMIKQSIEKELCLRNPFLPDATLMKEILKYLIPFILKLAASLGNFKGNSNELSDYLLTHISEWQREIDLFLQKKSLMVNVTEKQRTQWSKSEELIIQLKSLNSCKTRYFEAYQNHLSNSTTHEHQFGDMNPYETMNAVIASYERNFGDVGTSMLLEDNSYNLKKMVATFEALQYQTTLEVRNGSTSLPATGKSPEVNTLEVFPRLWKDIINILEIEDSLHSKKSNFHQSQRISAMLSGSTIDGVSTAKWFSPNTDPEIEMDFMYEFGVYPKQLQFLFQPIQGKDVFVKVISNRIHEKMSIYKKQANNLSAFAHPNGFLDSYKFRNYFYATNHQNLRRELNSKEKAVLKFFYEYNIKGSKPSTQFADQVQFVGKAGITSITTLNIDDINFTFSFDKIPCLRLLFWPTKAKTWLTCDTEWLPLTTRLEIAKIGCHLVPKSSSDGNQSKEWRLSFSVVENELFRMLSVNQKVSFYLLKVLFYMHIKQIGENVVNVKTMKLRNIKKTEHEFHSYMIKTLMLWAYDEFPPNHDIWIEENLEQAVQQLLSMLADALKTRRLPHYFVPTWNLLCDVSRENLDMALDRVNCMKKSLVNYVPQDVQAVCDITEEKQRIIQLLTYHLLYQSENLEDIYGS